jgi:hypothetical protein
MEGSGMQQVSFWSMFVRPISTLDSLREQPRWLFPILISGIISAAVNLYVIQRIGLNRLIEATTNAKAMIDPQAILQNALDHKTQILFFQALSTFVGAFLVALVTAMILWLLLTVCGYNVSFKQGLAVVVHVNLLSVVLREGMMMLAASFIHDVNQFDLNNPLATNIAFFVKPASPAILKLLSSLDVITFINMTLLIVGMTKVCRKLPIKAASLMVLGPWMIYIGANIAIKSLMS